MDIYRMDSVPWMDTQLFYHARARSEHSGLFLFSPKSPYVCVGLHQVLEQAVHLAYCKEAQVPLFRREMGGGTVYLDEGCLCCQIVLPRAHPLAQGSHQAFHRRLLQPLLDVYHALGVAATVRPVNVLEVNGRKLADTGVAEIGTSVVFSATLFLNMDETLLPRLFRAANYTNAAGFADPASQELTSLNREVKELPEKTVLFDLLEQHWALLLGPLVPREIDATLRDGAEDVRIRLCSPVWLFRGERRYRLRNMRVRTGIAVRHHLFQSPGGLIQAAVEFDEDLYRIISVFFSGDFFIYPSEALFWLEQALEGVYPEDTLAALKKVYKMLSLETPGISPEDWYKALGFD